MDQPIEKKFSVPFTHRLLFTKGIFEPGNPLLANTVSADAQKAGPVRLYFVVDSGVRDAHTGLEKAIKAYCQAHRNAITCTGILIVPGGESVKNTETHARRLLQGIEEHGICRHSVVIAIGGGAVIDMAGYAAAIAHRGVRLLRVPTTVLAQNDAAVGVKNGINYFGKKNFIGTFAVPLAIINDREFLTTLEDRDWIAGTSEAVKVALIKDPAFFRFLEKEALRLNSREIEPMQELIHRCAELHMDHIADGGDPFEAGSSRPLDFGHWAAHKMEHLTNYSLRHGEAVAIGMAIDVNYSYRMGHLPGVDRDRILDLLHRLGFRLELPVLEGVVAEELLKGLEEFREHLGGILTITLLDGIGVKKDVHEIDHAVMKAAIEDLAPGKKVSKAS